MGLWKSVQERVAYANDVARQKKAELDAVARRRAFGSMSFSQLVVEVGKEEAYRLRNIAPPPGEVDGYELGLLTAVAERQKTQAQDGSELDRRGHRLVAADGRTFMEFNCKASLWGDVGVFKPDVVGESFRGKELQDRRLAPGQPLRLVAEPTNQYDPNAIAVRSWDGKVQAGYIKRSQTKTVRRLFAKADGPVHVASWCEVRKGKARVSLEVMMWQGGRLHGLDVPAHPEI